MRTSRESKAGEAGSITITNYDHDYEAPAVIVTRDRNRNRNRLSVALVLAAALSVHAADWPEFRGPTGQGIAPAQPLATAWSAASNIVWQVAIPGGGWSSPVVLGKRVYLTTAVAPTGGGNLSLRVLCLDTHSGKTLWNTEVFSVASIAAHKKNSQASPTPIAEDGRLYVHFGPYGTAALDADGRVLWRNTSLKYPPVHGNGGSPALVGDALVFGCDGGKDPFVVALHKATGAVLWKTAREQKVGKTFSFTTPLAITVEGRTELISPASGAVMAYDPKDGRELWRARYGEGYSVVPRPVFGHGLLFLCTGYDRPTLIAVRPGGNGDVTDTRMAWKISKSAPNTPSPLLIGDELYFISDAGVMTCADAKSGEVHWQERLGGGFSASPVFGDGKIYAINEEGVTSVVKPGKTFVVLASNDLKERALASPAIADGGLYIRTEKHLWRVQAPVESK